MWLALSCFAMPQDGVITAILRVLQANEIMPSVAVSVIVVDPSPAAPIVTTLPSRPTVAI